MNGTSVRKLVGLSAAALASTAIMLAAPTAALAQVAAAQSTPVVMDSPSPGYDAVRVSNDGIIIQDIVSPRDPSAV